MCGLERLATLAALTTAAIHADPLGSVYTMTWVPSQDGGYHPKMAAACGFIREDRKGQQTTARTVFVACSHWLLPPIVACSHWLLPSMNGLILSLLPVRSTLFILSRLGEIATTKLDIWIIPALDKGFQPKRRWRCPSALWRDPPVANLPV